MYTEQNDNAIFKLEVDEIAKAHMLEMGRWGKFLAIVGFIMLGLGLVGGYFYAMFLTSYLETINGGANTGMVGWGVYAGMVIGIALAFYPVFALYRFGAKIKPALNTMNREQFNAAFANLKGMFKYCGILTIIMLCFYGLMIVLVLVAVGMR